MERPVYLREEVFRLILTTVRHLSDEELRSALRKLEYPDVRSDLNREDLVAIILDRPSRYLCGVCGMLIRTDLLTDVFIEFDDDELDAGHTYLIDAEAAEEIASGDPTILLHDGNEVVMVPRSRIERALKSGCLIDYRDRKP